MVKFPEATKRLFENVFVCKKCKTKIRSSYQKVISKSLKCRKCSSRSFRAIKKSIQK